MYENIATGHYSCKLAFLSPYDTYIPGIAIIKSQSYMHYRNHTFMDNMPLVGNYLFLLADIQNFPIKTYVCQS